MRWDRALKPWYNVINLRFINKVSYLFMIQVLFITIFALILYLSTYAHIFCIVYNLGV